MLLLDHLDARGADLADVRERATLLKSAGAAVTVVAVSEGLEPDASLASGLHVAAPPAVPAACRSFLRSGGHDRIIVVCATEGGGRLAATLPTSIPAHWWPTGTTSPSGSPGVVQRIARRVRGERGLPALWGSTAGGVDGLEALAGCAVAGRRTGRTLPLWDGDVILAPEGLAGPGGADTLAAFADLAATWTALDLVSWAHPQAEAVRRARQLGIEPRTHHTGPPPRMAEAAWWTQALAVVLTGEEPLAGGLVLRALASGCPVLCVPRDPAFAAFAAALAREGCARVATGRRETSAALAELLERGPGVERSVERGRALASRYTRDALRTRLVQALGTTPAIARRAAAA